MKTGNENRSKWALYVFFFFFSSHFYWFSMFVIHDRTWLLMRSIGFLIIWRRTQHWQNWLWFHSAKAVQLPGHRAARPHHTTWFPSSDEAKLPRQEEQHQQQQHRWVLRIRDFEASECECSLWPRDVIHAGTVNFSVIWSSIWHSLLPEFAERKRAAVCWSAAHGSGEDCKVGFCLCLRWWINLPHGLCKGYVEDVKPWCFDWNSRSGSDELLPTYKLLTQVQMFHSFSIWVYRFVCILCGTIANLFSSM